MMAGAGRAASAGAIPYQLLVTARVKPHLPVSFGASGMHHRLVGMRPDAPTLIGIAPVAIGLVSAYGPLPRFSRAQKAPALEDVTAEEIASAPQLA